MPCTAVIVGLVCFTMLQQVQLPQWIHRYQNNAKCKLTYENLHKNVTLLITSFRVQLFSRDNFALCWKHKLSYFRLFTTCSRLSLPPVLWHCWLGSRKGIRPVKKLEWWGTGMVICLQRDADLHMVQLMPLPLTVSCFSKIQIGFTFLVPAHLGSPRKRAVKRVCVCSRLSGLMSAFERTSK